MEGLNIVNMPVFHKFIDRFIVIPIKIPGGLNLCVCVGVCVNCQTFPKISMEMQRAKNNPNNFETEQNWRRDAL